MKPRGFISLELIAVLGLVAGLGVAAWWLDHRGYQRAKDEDSAAAAIERAKRVKMISDLALDLGKTQLQLQAERIAHESQLMDNQRAREGKLHDYVPQNTASAACITRGFVQYVNSAAAGVPLGVRPGPGVAQASAGIGTDTVAAITARNYDKYQLCKGTVAGILKEFDTKRSQANTVIDRINQRVQRAERKVQ